VEQRGPPALRGNANWYGRCGEHAGSLLKQSYPVTQQSLLGKYLEKTIIQKDTRTPVFIAAVSPIARTWKNLKCPSTEDWTKKMFYIHTHMHTHTVENYSAVKNNEIMPFASTWMDLEVIILSEVRQRKTYATSLVRGI